MRKRGYLTRITAVLAAVFVLVLSLPQLPAHAATLLTDMGEGADITYTKWYYYADPASPNLHCSFDTSRIDGIFEQWDERLFHESEAITGREDCKHIAVYYGFQGYTTGSSPAYYDREYVHLISLSDLGVDNRYGLMLHDNGIFIVHPTKTTVKYFSALSDKVITDASDTLVHDYQKFEEVGVRNDRNFPSSSLSFNGVTLYGWRITSSLMDSYVCEGTIFNTDIPVFTDATAYMNYYETGDMSGAIRLPDSMIENITYDGSLGFDKDSFYMRKKYDSRLQGCVSYAVEYALSQNTIDMMTQSPGDWYLEQELTISYGLNARYGTGVGSSVNEYGEFSITLLSPIEPWRQNSVTVNVVDLFAAGNGDVLPSSNNILCGVTTVNSNARINQFARCLLGSSQKYDVFNKGVDVVTDVLSETDKIPFLGMMTGWVGDVIESATNIVLKMDYTQIDGNFRIRKNNVRSSGAHATLDLLSGVNSSYTYSVDDLGNETMNTDYRSDKNEYVVDASTGDTYYYDYSNHTVNNYTTPSANFSDNIAMTHTFASPLHMFVDNAADLAPTILVNNYPSSGGGSGSSSSDGYDITIEDDDYTHDTLVDYMKHGFELFDNTDTGEKGDGLMAGAAALFGMLGDDMAAMLGFGVGSVVVINILRSLIKR